jgi:protein-tyrosine phosphatase
MEAGCPQPHRRKLRRLMEFAPEGSSPVVPDPYLGGPQGFEQVLDLIEHASDGLTKHLEKLIRRKSDPSV